MYWLRKFSSFKDIKYTVFTRTRGGSRAAATSTMERFVITVNSFQPLTIITKRSILYVAAALDPPLTDNLRLLRKRKNLESLWGMRSSCGICIYSWETLATNFISSNWWYGCQLYTFQQKDYIDTIQAFEMLLLKALCEEDFGHELQQYIFGFLAVTWNKLNKRPNWKHWRISLMKKKL